MIEKVLVTVLVVISVGFVSQLTIRSEGSRVKHGRATHFRITGLLTEHGLISMACTVGASSATAHLFLDFSLDRNLDTGLGRLLPTFSSNFSPVLLLNEFMGRKSLVHHDPLLVNFFLSRSFYKLTSLINIGSPWALMRRRHRIFNTNRRFITTDLYLHSLCSSMRCRLVTSSKLD
jgi:hypothetical protein